MDKKICDLFKEILNNKNLNEKFYKEVDENILKEEIYKNIFIALINNKITEYKKMKLTPLIYNQIRILENGIAWVNYKN